MEFLNDSQNLHLFEEEGTDQINQIRETEATNHAPEKNKGTKRNHDSEPAAAKRPAKKPKKKTDGEQVTKSVTSASEPKKVQTKTNKNPSTVICRFSPGKDSVENNNEIRLSSPPPSIQDSNSTFVVGSLSPTFSLTSSSSPPTTPTSHAIPLSPEYISPKTPSFYNPPPPLPDLTPLHDLDTRRTSTPITTTARRQLINTDKDELTQHMKGLEHNLKTYIDKKFEELFRLIRANNSQQLTQPLTQSSATINSISSDEFDSTPPIQPSTSSDERYNHITSATNHQQQPMEELVDDLPPTNTGTISSERLIHIRNVASSKKNFAVCLVRELFQPTELFGRNVAGVLGKQALDPAKIMTIKSLVSKCYPVPAGEEHSSWKECRKAIDSFLRNNSRKQVT